MTPKAQRLATLATLCLTLSAPAQSPLADQITTLLSAPAVSRAHWGIDVTTLDGAPIYVLNEAQYFQPASNTKLYTTAAALAVLGPDTTTDTRIVARGTFPAPGHLTGDIVLIGSADANISGRTIPYLAPSLRPKPAPPAPPALRYLEAMADQVAASGLKVVNGDILGDDTLLSWDPYPQDWSIDDTIWGYGAPVSALTITDNQLVLTVSPAPQPGLPATVTLDPAFPYYTLDFSVTTGPAKSGSHVQIERPLGSRTLRVYGSISVDSHPDEEEIAIHDPADYAALALKSMLESRGILVTGTAHAVHHLPTDSRGFLSRLQEPGSESAVLFEHKPVASTCLQQPPATAPEQVLATHTSPTLLQDITVTNKVSQNLHAELLLRRLGRATPCADGSVVAGARVVRAFLQQAGVDKDDFIFYDGSGLSGHDLTTPRATAKLLQFATQQPWFAAWKSTLPVGGMDGSLITRFPKEPLKNHVFAKTGTLSEARALSGYLECASGKIVIFSIMSTSHTPTNAADREAMDKIVAAIAATN